MLNITVADGGIRALTDTEGNPISNDDFHVVSNAPYTIIFDSENEVVLKVVDGSGKDVDFQQV